MHSNQYKDRVTCKNYFYSPKIKIMDNWINGNLNTLFSENNLQNKTNFLIFSATNSAYIEKSQEKLFQQQRDTKN